MVPARALLVVTVVVALLAPPVTAAGVGGDGPPASVARTLETDNTVTRIALQPNGDGRWTVRIRTRLDTDADVEEYRTFQDQFRTNTSRYLDPFATRMLGTVADASNVTGRTMAARNFTASTTIQEVPRRWGVVSFSFTWTNFADSDGDALVVGDVFEGGFFLARNDTLVVETPPGYVVESTDPEPTSTEGDTVTWEGREDFADRRPRVVVAPTGAGATTSTPTSSPPGNGSGGQGDGLIIAVVVALTVVGALATGFVLRRSGWRGGPESDAAVATDAEGGDLPVRTDAEKVEALLADGEGRMKQAAVADELGWSASKTSRVVADLVEQGRVEKLRVGRENVLDLVEST